MNFFSQYPASSASSNASVGTNGATAPTSSTEVAGINNSGNLQPLQTNAAGSLLVTNDPAVPIHVIVDSSALPSGAATALKQDSQITQETAIAVSTASIDTKSTSIATNTSATATSVASIDTKTPTVGQKAMAASSPVVIASDQSTLTITGSVSNASIGTTASAVPASATMVGGSDGTNLRAVKVSAAGIVSVDASGTTVNTNLSTVNGSVTTTGSGTAGTGTQRVILASDQTSIPVAATLQAGAAVIGHVIVDAGSAVIGHVINDAGSAIIGKVGIDQTTPGTTNGVQVNAALPAGSNVIGHVIVDAGSAVIGHVIADAGSAIIGKVGIDQTTPGTTNAVALTQVGSTTTATGNGVVSAGVQRVAIASDNTAFSVNSVQSGTWTVQPGNTANTTAWLTAETTSATSTLSNVASSASSVSILASNASRKQAMFYNDSTQILYLKLGTTASNSSYTVQIPASGYYELPGGKVYTGAIDGIWASANGNLRVTELT